jgi:hypothetical protein
MPTLIVAAPGSALTSHDYSGSRAYFISSDNHVHEVAWVGTYWNTTDLTSVATGAAPPAIDDSALTSHDDNGSRVYFISSDNHVHEVAWVGTYWNTTDLTSITGAPPAIAGSALTSHNTSVGPAGGGSRVCFISSDNHVHEFEWVGDTWITGDLTSATNAPPAIAGSALHSHDVPGSGSGVYFISSDNHVHELAWTGTAWNTTDLTSVATGAAPPAISGSALHSHDYNGSRVYFISSDDHVHELAWIGNTWNTTDLTSGAGAPSAISGSALHSHNTSVGPPAGGASRAYFISGDNHVHELAWTGSTWNTTDLSILIQPTNWMGSVDGSRYLSQLSIPATHDTLTFNATAAAQDQDVGFYITAQLKAGIRLFDLRLGEEPGTDRSPNS